MDVKHYVTRDGSDIIAKWLHELKDVQGKVAIIRRLNRIEHGNFGDSKFLRDGIHELRIDTGPGYRVYYGRVGSQVILLLCGGSKRTQDADIVRAVAYWRDWSDRRDE